MLKCDRRWCDGTDRLVQWCVGVMALQMAQTSGVETRLRTILRSSTRRQGVSRKSVAGAALVALGVVTPLAALRPLARADAPPPRHGSTQAQGAEDPQAPIREKLAFVTSVHLYTRLVYLYSDLAESEGQYEQAVNKKEPGKITDLLAPGYTLNGQPTAAEQAVLGSQTHRYGSGYHIKFQWVCYTRTEANGRVVITDLPYPLPENASDVSIASDGKQTAFVKGTVVLPPVPYQISTSGTEYWHYGGRGKPGYPVSTRYDYWIMTPHGLKLLATDIMPWKKATASPTRNR